MKLSGTAEPSELLAIYLNDHRAILTGEIALAERCRSAHSGTDLASTLTRHIGHVESDRDLVDELIQAAGASISALKSAGAKVAERLGRLKLNGQLLKQSALSPVVELEGLVLATHGRAAMWETLIRSHPPRHLLGAIGDRAAVVTLQRSELEPHLRDAVADAFDPAKTDTAEE